MLCRAKVLIATLLLWTTASWSMTIPWSVEWDGRWKFCFNHTESIGGIEWTDASINATHLVWLDEDQRPLSNITCNATVCSWDNSINECMIPLHNGTAYTIRFFVDDGENSNITLSSHVHGSWVLARANVPARTFERRTSSHVDAHKMTETGTLATTPSWLWAPLVGSAVAIVALVAGLGIRRRIMLATYRQQRNARELQVAQSIPPADIQSQSRRAQEDLDQALEDLVRKRTLVNRDE